MFSLLYIFFNVNEKTIFSDKSNERAKSDAKKERRVDKNEKKDLQLLLNNGIITMYHYVYSF